MARLRKIVCSAQQTINVVVDCLEWRSKLRSTAALMVLKDVDDADDDDDDDDDHYHDNCDKHTHTICEYFSV